MKKIALNFGILAGVIIIVYTTLVFVIMGDFDTLTAEDMGTMEALGYLRYLILILAVIFAVYTYKKQAETSPRYWALAKTGMLTAVFIGALVGLMEFSYILYNPDFIEQYTRLTIESMEKKGASAEAIVKARQDIESFKWMANAPLTGIFYFFETTAVGCAASLLVSLFFKSKRVSG